MARLFEEQRGWSDWPVRVAERWEDLDLPEKLQFLVTENWRYTVAAGAA